LTPGFRDAVLKAFRKIGGVKHLAEWAKENPTEFYKLAGRLLTQEKAPPPPQAKPIQGRFAVSGQIDLFKEEP
jgi:hypothetical protein